MAPPTTPPFHWHVFVLSGEFSVPRAALGRLLRDRGATVAPFVDARTTHVLVQDRGAQTAAARFARECTLPVVDEAWLRCKGCPVESAGKRGAPDEDEDEDASRASEAARLDVGAEAKAEEQGAADPAPPGEFTGMRIHVSSGIDRASAQQLEHIVRGAGGCTEYGVWPGTTHLVSNGGDDSRVDEALARARGVAIVHETWVRSRGVLGTLRRTTPEDHARADGKRFAGMSFRFADAQGSFSVPAAEIERLLRRGGGRVVSGDDASEATHVVTSPNGDLVIGGGNETLVTEEWVAAGGVPSEARDGPAAELNAFHLPLFHGWGADDWPDAPWYSRRDAKYEANKAEALRLFLEGPDAVGGDDKARAKWKKEASAIAVRYGITPLWFLGNGNLHPDEPDGPVWTDLFAARSWQERIRRSDKWFDFDVADGAGVVFPLRACVCHGCWDSGTGWWGLVRNRETGEAVMNISSSAGGGCESTVEVLPACRAFQDRDDVARELAVWRAGPGEDNDPDAEDFYDEDRHDYWLLSRTHLSEESQLARICVMAMLVHKWVDQPAVAPLKLRVEFGAARLDAVLHGHGVEMPAALCNLIAAYDPPPAGSVPVPAHDRARAAAQDAAFARALPELLALLTGGRVGYQNGCFSTGPAPPQFSGGAASFGSAAPFSAASFASPGAAGAGAASAAPPAKPAPFKFNGPLEIGSFSFAIGQQPAAASEPAPGAAPPAKPAPFKFNGPLKFGSLSFGQQPAAQADEDPKAAGAP